MLKATPLDRTAAPLNRPSLFPPPLLEGARARSRTRKLSPQLVHGLQRDLRDLRASKVGRGVTQPGA